MMLVLLIISILCISTTAEIDSKAETGLVVTCAEAGWDSCCLKGECLVTEAQCFCDHSCHKFKDCCADINSTCPSKHKDACTNGEIQISRDKIQLCTNGTFNNICTLPEPNTMSINDGSLLKRQTNTDSGSGGDSGNIVEIGFTMGAYTVSESDLNAVVCVQVTAGILTPAEIAIVTVTTLSGTAKADEDYESVIEDVVFDGNTVNETLCIDIPIIDDPHFEPMEQFTVSLACSSSTVTLDDVTMSATVYIDTTDIFSGDSCAELGMTVQCCTESDDTCHSLNSTCFCDPYCFKRGDCCEDIFMYEIELSVSDEYFHEGYDDFQINVCTVLTGRYDNPQDISVVLHFINSPSADDADYRSSNRELSFSIEEQQLQQPGESIVKCMYIDIIDDEIVEGEQVFSVEIETVTPSSVVQCNPDTVTIHIIDDEVAVLGLVKLPTTVPEIEPLKVCAVTDNRSHSDINITVDVLFIDEQGTIITSHELLFPAGDSEVCILVLVDNDILDWSWELLVILDQPYPSTSVILNPNNSTIITRVIDNEVNSASLHFESATIEVTEGHRGVVCVILEGIPNEGMNQELLISVTIMNSTAELGLDYSLGDNKSDSIPLLFHGGYSRSRACGVIDTMVVSQCRENVQLNMKITLTDLPVTIQPPLIATLTIIDSNTTCICPTREDKESLYWILLLTLAAVSAVLFCILITVIVICCSCQCHRYTHKQATKPITDGEMTIQNIFTDHDRQDRTRTITSLGSATYNSFRTHDSSDVRKAIEARNKMVRSIVIAQETDIDEPLSSNERGTGGDYEDIDYEIPVSSENPREPSATLL